MTRGWRQVLSNSRNRALPRDGGSLFDHLPRVRGSVLVPEDQLSAGPHTYGLAGWSHGVKMDALRIYLKGTTPPGP